MWPKMYLEPEITPMHVQSINDKGVKTIPWGKNNLPKIVLGKLDSQMENNDTGLLFFAIHKNSLKMN